MWRGKVFNSSQNKHHWNNWINYVTLFKLSEYEFIKEGKKVGCGGSYEIEKYGKKVDEASCKAKCDANELCTYLWSRESSNQSSRCVLYSSCDGKSEPYKGKLFKKIQGMRKSC